MSIVSLPELKAHLNLDHDLDDALLAQKIEAAEAHAASFIGGPIPDPIPATIKQAVLMLAAYWYEVREAAPPVDIQHLLQAHRAWVV